MRAEEKMVLGFSQHKKGTTPLQRNVGTVEKHTTRGEEKAVQHLEERVVSVEDTITLQPCVGA